ncbi:methyltransferase domain-containing protein [Rhodococcus tibetensis]|uniref:Methyltransferase domain-containing protein n=1 Tax=Rhodococcus tibetensis TaxID=2965064 RepID=A0ABT1QDK6_9NOCA|nr:methyltransferase domain-containing protein [Rhodococcus sp. FXJ9.536]MCQ4120369.1 methyltransferase domain-containing protein [Rhodococcus sp. FXJ9.536]
MAEPAAPLSFRSDEIDRSALEQLASVLDIQAERPGIRRLRAWSSDALRLESGERVLDIGSGTGSETQAMATAVGASGQAIGLDPNPGMVLLARERAAAADSTAQFFVGTVYSLPFATDSLDAVRCERVFQHLTEPERAAAEVARVLKPGGRAVLLDSDWGTAILHPGDPDVLQRITEVMLTHTANPQSGRLLPGQLTRAGLVVEDAGSQALMQEPGDATGPLVRMMTDAAVAEGTISPPERTSFLDQLESGAREGDFHMSVTMFAYLARKA